MLKFLRLPDICCSVQPALQVSFPQLTETVEEDAFSTLVIHVLPVGHMDDTTITKILSTNMKLLFVFILHFKS